MDGRRNEFFFVHARYHPEELVQIINLLFQSVSGKYRTTVPILHQLPFFFGNVIVAGLAYWLRDWRKLNITLAFLSSFAISYWFIITESPRWLLATGKADEAYGNTHLLVFKLKFINSLFPIR